MLTRPDFLEKQIVVIFSHQLRGLRFANENLIVEEDGKIIEQATLHKIFAIFLIGEATISTKLIQELKAFGIVLVLMKRNLELIDVIGDDMNGNILLREKQYSLFHDIPTTTLFARTCICNKISNQKALLSKIREKDEVLKDTADKLHSLANDAYVCSDSERLLGIEWNAARYFFHEFYREMDWMWRYPRTKIDKNNLLLDMGYTFLFHFIETLLCLYGFDLYEGFYHKRFYQRKSLVCDVQEPFRCIIDEALKKAYNLWRISEKDFWFSNGSYFLKADAIGKYSSIFSRSILNHREELYDYTYAFYRHIIDQKKPFPYFKFS